jgi:ubiquinone/menaquinone biosynthesis C-methylase UbiE
VRDHPYLLANSATQAQDRFTSLSALFDSTTFRHLEAVGLAPGWRCWEVGAGGAPVPARMASIVGPTGRVVATDIDTGWLEGAAATFEVLTHDVATDEPPGEDFDLVHARLVLVHVPGRDAGLRNMVRALRPGGWVVLEDFDPALMPLACLEESTPAEQRANKIRRGFRELLSKRGVDLEYGRKLPRLLREAGLESVEADAYFPVTKHACRILEQANTAQVAEGLVATALATRDEINDHLVSLAAGEFDPVTPPLISAWGQKP